eukprot:TRINITY_DN25461_c0_g1_i1.p1 TRINITY_DN25461_c0_g1~~TRINITY_DN25461_c0_g1_i1.p1  ORF type:complete len:164 (+),score=19.43 TRINITY_DN25461_c0_g1_i1:142-633(+)
MHNNLSDLPPSLAYCTSLSVLHLSHNKFQVWPAVIPKLPQLSYLDASYNHFDELPFWLGRMKNITSLNVRGNKLVTVSHTISQMVRLKKLDLAHNNITELPSTVALLEDTLKEINLEGNQLKFTGDNSIDTIMNYLKDNLSILSPILTAMMVVLGPPKPGKIS